MLKYLTGLSGKVKCLKHSEKNPYCKSTDWWVRATQAELLGFVLCVTENALRDLLISHLAIFNTSFFKYIQRLIKWRDENKTWESGISCHIYKEMKINPSFHSYCFCFWKDTEIEYFKRGQIEYLNISAHVKIQSCNSLSTLLQMWKWIAHIYLWV